MTFLCSVELNNLFKFAVSLLVITNAFGAIPIFLSLTAENNTKERRAIALKAGLSVAIIFVIVIFSGQFILNFFGISVDAFRVAGGMIIFMLGISMLNSKQSSIKHTKEEQRVAENKDDIAIVPLALPIIAGPGTISTIIIYSNNMVNPYPEKLYLAITGLLVALFITFCLYFASNVGKYLGVSGIRIATRVMGMILAALAIEMITSGILKLLPGLG